VTLLLST